MISLNIMGRKKFCRKDTREKKIFRFKHTGLGSNEYDFGKKVAGILEDRIRALKN